MEDRIRFITYKNKPILLADCSHCTAAEVASISKLLPSYVTAEPAGSVLLLGDFTGAEINRDAVTQIKHDAVFNRPHLKRSAWVGADVIPQVFYEHIKVFAQRDLPKFATREEALEWLVSD
jgi:hypothetical protein